MLTSDSSGRAASSCSMSRMRKSGLTVTGLRRSVSAANTAGGSRNVLCPLVFFGQRVQADFRVYARRSGNGYLSGEAQNFFLPWRQHTVDFLATITVVPVGLVPPRHKKCEASP